MKKTEQLGSLYLHQNWLQKRVRLCKNTEHFSLWAPWEKLSAPWRVSLALFMTCQWEQPKREKKCHMASPAAGTECSMQPIAEEERGRPDFLLRLTVKGGSRRCQGVFCKSLYKGPHKAGFKFNQFDCFPYVNNFPSIFIFIPFLDLTTILVPLRITLGL